MILFLTTADTEVLAALRADFDDVRALNPTAAGAPAADALMDDAPAAVIVRLLGGRGAWPGFERLAERCRADGVALLAFSGEAAADAELTAASTAPGGVLADAFAYLVQGGVENMTNLFRFVSDTILRTGFGFDPPIVLPEDGYWLRTPDDLDPVKPTVGVVFYRTHWMSGNTDFVATLVDQIEAAGANALPVFCYSLRGQDPAALRLLGQAGVDAIVMTVLAMGGSGAADQEAWAVPALAALGVPVIQGVCATVSRAAWEASAQGLTPLDTAMQVAIPEFDGRIISVPFSFKESDASGVARYVADPERAARVAGTAVRFARLGRTDNAGKRVAIVLSNYPTKHSRIGNAVGLDTPVSAVRLLDRLTEDGYDTGEWLSLGWSGDELIHRLIAAGGFDTEFLTEEQLRQQPARVSSTTYAEWFAALPADLQQSIVDKWGPPPGELYVDQQDLTFATLRFGNVMLAIQPPRGFGENPIAIYHDPDLPPTHHYLGCYRWLDQEWGADAIVHLGKHGTLEWMPGKGLGLSASCAPDAVLADVPLVYPFVVNDPGEGTQAKRRGHATIVDHLVPPMTRAETYGELAQLEQLLDEYYQVQTLDPAKLPAIQGEIWQLLRTAELTRDLGFAGDEDLDDVIVHVDSYLCEIKDAQIRGGLHILGDAPAGDGRRDLVLAILRLPQAGLPGLRAAIGSVFGIAEAAALDDGSRSDVDWLEDRARELVEAMDAKGWDASAAESVVADVLSRPGDAVTPTRPDVTAFFADSAKNAVTSVVEVLKFAGNDVVPRLAATTREIDRIADALSGRYIPAGPSGSPTRGRADVLPTGKNFYSVDPKALPSELSWDVGQRLATDLCERYRREEGGWPTSIGLVMWGTAAMRTHGDDIAEALALMGVRPVWNRENRRVTGLELMTIEALGRPRVDVTVRISGFFRDAFPHLVQLLDDAVAMVAEASDEGELDNPIAAAVARDVRSGVERRRATARVFGSKPGAYGAGLLPLIDARNWQTDADLAEVYAVWGGYAYGRGLDGVEARGDMERTFSRMQVAVKNTDTREHDVFDSDDYFQYHGGMVAAVRALTGSSPKAYIGDSADPARVKTRDLREETARVFRTRVANPKWISAMQRHGYKGAFELSATVDYLFGYDATAGVVEDWMYETLSKSYVFDETNRAFMQQSNPWALRAVAERLLEAADRGLWAEPEDETLDGLRRVYLELEGDLEEGITS